jgi:signal transduction histidine kinase
MMGSVSGWRLRPAAADWLVCVATSLATAVGPTDKVAHWMPHVMIVPLAAAQGLALLSRRRLPLAALAATTLVGSFMIAAGYPDGPASVGACFAAYAVALYWGQGEGRGRGIERHAMLRGAQAVLGATAAFTVSTLAPGARGRPTSWGLPTVEVVLAEGLPIASAWVLGYAIRTRRAYIAELTERAARLEAEEGERAARAVADERLRIARELHDVIGHSIGLITIQAEAATRSARANPDMLPGYLATISATSRMALAEMRHVLAVLRPDAKAELSPQPGLEALPELVARLEAGGLEIRLDAEPLDLPPGIGLAVYRIVQESLTNVLKHAGAGARASVTIARGGGSVRVSVHDDGAGPAAPAPSAAHGIVGMRERVALYGGSVRAGARPAGGFEVEAWIPLSEGAP